MTFWAYLRFQVLPWALRATWRVFRWAVIAAVLIVAAPVTVVAAVTFASAWLRGWPPAKLWRAAAWALPMTGVYLAGRALQARTWRALALAPVHDWERAWHLAALAAMRRRHLERFTELETEQDAIEAELAGRDAQPAKIMSPERLDALPQILGILAALPLRLRHKLY